MRLRLFVVNVFSKRSAQRVLIVLLLSVVALLSGLASAQATSYKVYLDFNHPLHAMVEAELDLQDGSVFTAQNAGGYAWWEFTKNLREVGEDGRSVPLGSAAPGRWILPEATKGHVRLAYDVDLAFTESVRNGDLRGGLFWGDSLYVVNRALFVMSNAAGRKIIEFEVPSSCAIATPWPRISGQTFRAADNRELT